MLITSAAPANLLESKVNLVLNDIGNARYNLMYVGVRAKEGLTRLVTLTHLPNDAKALAHLRAAPNVPFSCFLPFNFHR